MTIAMIAAVANGNVIGKNNQLIWHIPEDLKHFKALTTGHAVIMGRKTFESIGKPLPNRKNIVISRDAERYAHQNPSAGLIFVPSFQDALETAKGEKVFIAGGESIYRMALPFVDTLYITRIHADFDGDAFFPEIDMKLWQEIERRDSAAEGIAVSFLTYKQTKS